MRLIVTNTSLQANENACYVTRGYLIENIFPPYIFACEIMWGFYASLILLADYIQKPKTTKLMILFIDLFLNNHYEGGVAQEK